MKAAIRRLRQGYRGRRWARAAYDPLMAGYYWLYLAARLAAAFLEVPCSAWRSRRLASRDKRWRAAHGDWFSYQGRIYWIRRDGSLERIER